MYKTSDEIKKGLECCCNEDDCPSECPYFRNCDGDGFALERDSLALIQQLQDDLQLEKKRTDALAMELAVLKNAKKQLEDRFREATKKVEQLQAERDAAVSFLKGDCWACKFSDCSFAEEPCASCFADRREKWQWRGVQKEE